jgi:hypothetical protein
MPTALGPKTAAFYLLAFGAVFVIARAPKALTLFEKSALVVLLVVAVIESQGMTWFALFGLIVLPNSVRTLSLPHFSGGSHRVVTFASGATIVIALIVASSRPASWYARDYPPLAANVVRDAAGSDGKVFARGAFGDWLLLVEPSLRGRIAYDVRYELLPRNRFTDVAAVAIGRWDSQRILRPFRIVVLNPSEAELRDTLTRSGNWQRIDAGSTVVVLRRLTG